MYILWSRKLTQPIKYLLANLALFPSLGIFIFKNLQKIGDRITPEFSYCCQTRITFFFFISQFVSVSFNLSCDLRLDIQKSLTLNSRFQKIPREKKNLQAIWILFIYIYPWNVIFKKKKIPTRVIKYEKKQTTLAGSHWNEGEKKDNISYLPLFVGRSSLFTLTSSRFFFFILFLFILIIFIYLYFVVKESLVTDDSFAIW